MANIPGVGLPSGDASNSDSAEIPRKLFHCSSPILRCRLLWRPPGHNGGCPWLLGLFTSSLKTASLQGLSEEKGTFLPRQTPQAGFSRLTGLVRATFLVPNLALGARDGICEAREPVQG